MPAVEVFEPFASPVGHRRETTELRSTWLASSLRALRKRDLIDNYRAKLPQRYHAPVFESVAGHWLPIEVAVAHYMAIDELGIGAQTAYEMGREVQENTQSIIAVVTLRLTRSAGVTPWTILGQCRKLWDLTWRGGDFAIYKLGPKEAQVEVVAWSIARSAYVHHSFRGVMEGVVSAFCTRAYVREVPEKSTSSSAAYRISWA